MYQILALDLDGTVLKSDRTISADLIRTVQYLAQKIPVVIVTGRHHTTARPYYHELGLTGPIICCNGAYVYDYRQEKVIQHNAIPKPLAKDFLQLAQDQGMAAVLYTTHAMMHSITHPVPYIDTLADWAEQYPKNLKPQIYKVADLRQELDANDFIWKFVLEGEDVASFADQCFVAQNFSAEQSWQDRFDFAYKGNTKGAALGAYLASLGIDPQHMVAIGDHHNDISMLKLAGLGVAMGNAGPEIKAIADQVAAGHNDEELGLSNTLRQIFGLDEERI
ncbi:Cof-type HAD-IIB family hydrolase [Marinomonas sp.]